jgi:hypothetical protein
VLRESVAVEWVFCDDSSTAVGGSVAGELEFLP